MPKLAVREDELPRYAGAYRQQLWSPSPTSSTLNHNNKFDRVPWEAGRAAARNSKLVLIVSCDSVRDAIKTFVFSSGTCELFLSKYGANGRLKSLKIFSLLPIISKSNKWNRNEAVCPNLTPRYENTVVNMIVLSKCFLLNL
jgi:hypothetical protein